MYKKIVHRKMFKTAAQVVNFALTNNFTVIECGGSYLYCYAASSFTLSDLRHHTDNDTVTAAYNCFGSFKLNLEQVYDTAQVH